MIPEKVETETFWEMVKRDFRSKRLWKVKILFMLHTAAMMSLFPFLTIHLKSQGINVHETAYIYALTPIAAIVAPPIMGYVADRLGNFKIYLAILGVIGGLLPLTFLAVPNARDNIYLKDNITAQINCGQPITTLQGIPCETKNTSMVNLTINACHLDCYKNYNLSFQDMSPNIFCDTGPCELTLSHHQQNQVLNVKLSKTKSNILQVATIYDDLNTFNGLVCNKKQELTDLLSKYGAKITDVVSEDSLDLEGRVKCELKCQTEVVTKDVCTKPYYVKERNVTLSFWLLMLLRVTFGMFFAGYMILMEGAVITVLNEYHGDLGLQRVWASIGAMAFSPISGLLMDYVSRGSHVTDFRPAFILFAVLKCICAVIVTQIDLAFKRASDTVWKDLKHLLKNTELIVYFLVCLAAGINFGYIENFLFWWLEALGAKKSLMGLTVAVGTAAGIPWLIFSGPIINKLGHMNVIVIGMLAYSGRLVGYSLISNPYYALPFEALECLTNSLMMTAFVTYANKLSSITTIASVLGIMGAMHFGFGRGAGSLFGGLMIGRFGERVTFRIFSVATAVVAILYFFYYLLSVRKKNRKEMEEQLSRFYQQNPRGLINMGYEKEYMRRQR